MASDYEIWQMQFAGKISCESQFVARTVLTL